MLTIDRKEELTKLCLIRVPSYPGEERELTSILSLKL